MKLSIVMPAYNERKTLREIVGRVLAVDLGDVEKELIIVDDGSRDGTRDILRELDGTKGVRAIYQPVNMGKGAAVWTGMLHATKSAVGGDKEMIASLIAADLSARRAACDRLATA